MYKRWIHPCDWNKLSLSALPVFCMISAAISVSQRSSFCCQDNKISLGGIYGLLVKSRKRVSLISHLAEEAIGRGFWNIIARFFDYHHLHFIEAIWSLIELTWFYRPRPSLLLSLTILFLASFHLLLGISIDIISLCL